jgi:drug/metabolite transporter (DMT)-like permease
MVIVALVAAGGFVWLIIIWNDPHRANFPWAPIVGMVLALVSIVSFGGFYLASRRLRVAIAGAFLLTYLVSLSYAVTVAPLTPAFESKFFGTLVTPVNYIVGFYFGSEAVIGASKVIAISKTPNADAAAIQAADRDLITPSSRPTTNPVPAPEASPSNQGPASTS